MSSLLKLHSLRMENYRNYKKVELKFSQDRTKTITIFHGSMSAGKTTIMNAINWCLYGKETHFINEGEGKPIPYKKALNETKLGESITTEVELIISDENGPSFQIVRRLISTRKNEQINQRIDSLANGVVDSGFSFEIEQQFAYIDRYTKDWEWIHDKDRINFHIEHVLPEDLSNFIFFNGEMLDKFFSTLQSQNIKNGIENVSGLNILNKTKDDLKKLQENYRRKSSASKIETAQLQLRLDRFNGRLQDLVKKRNEKEKNVLPKITEKLELQNILSKYPEAVIRQYQADLIKSRELIETKKKLIEINRNQQCEFLINNFAKILLSRPIQTCLDILNNAEQEGLIPPPVDYDYLQELISDNKCICGREIIEGTSEREELNKLSSQLIGSEIGNEAHDGRLIINEFLLLNISKNNLIEELDIFRKERIDLEKDIEKEIGNRDTIFKTLQQYPIEDIRTKGENLARLEKEIEASNNEIYFIRENEKTIENEIGDLNKKIDNATKEDEKVAIWVKRRELTQELIQCLEELYQASLSEVRSSVERYTNEIFRKLISRRWQLDRIEILPDYRIRVIDKDGSSNLKTLSAGQTLYLSLAFISSLRNVTAVNYPMVIDSPFGKVSGKERIWAAEDIPTFLPNTQITFLVTDTEYSSEVSNILTNEKLPSIRTVLLNNEKIWKEFNLIIEPDDNISSKTEVKSIGI